jgi:hypothetical protein
MPSEPVWFCLGRLGIFRRFWGIRACLILLLLCAFLSGNGAMSSHVLYGSFAGVPHSGQRFCPFGMRHASVRAFLGLNLLFAQYFSERFLAFRTVEKSDFQLHSFSFSVWTSSHFPCLSRSRNVYSTFWTVSHLIFLQHSQ